MTITQAFEGGAFAHCDSVGKGLFELTISPESIPINPSPWYAFKVHSDTRSHIRIHLNYSHSKHRYWPKYSHDFIHWQSLPASQWQLNESETKLVLQLKLEPGQQWIAAQDVITSAWYQRWFTQLSEHNAVQVYHYGTSVEGRKLHGASIQSDKSNPLVVLLGRAHPPEVTGAIGLKYFTSTLLSDTKLAQQFRNRFSVFIYPYLNPDGVANGHWRLNANGEDINRDWGPFSQPETLATFEDIQRHLQHTDLAVMLDFHSTRKDIFYVQPASLPSAIPAFAQRWIKLMHQSGLPQNISIKAGHNHSATNAKTFFYNQYQIPSITYEVADAASLEEIQHNARISANSFMQLLLDSLPATLD
ncbi:M14 family metallopeptidase [Lacimicrobium sp. SS2-24]|uniref:M14 family metallopeptidase n=1 Tax=Lacimicrobium sp. SS2-24 TaxID=2005569 RepID=UPI001439A8EB|nr:M14 family metallopeptidase [Lacimicrobium sp. SS2-24]